MVSPGEDTRHLKQSFLITASFTALLWLIKTAESLLGVSLIGYTIFPGEPGTLAGILWAPLIHGSFTHLFANTAPLLILGTVLLYGYPRSSRYVIPIVYFGTGLGVWLFARPAFHLGASGLTFGFMFFVFTVGVLRWDRRAIPISMIVFFLYGGMIWGVFPGKPDISYESHLFGAIIGVTLAVLLRHHDPLPPEKKYSWELEEESLDDADQEPPDNQW
ncbi:MAG: rhomboid family intramembrane serine protease [Thiotrichales bacterium]|nr:MAG: rhomboid family intramembrane serine protease [Thiotrichales bacterium]